MYFKGCPLFGGAEITPSKADLGNASVAMRQDGKHKVYPFMCIFLKKVINEENLYRSSNDGREPVCSS